jgi:hypothetical protein
MQYKAPPGQQYVEGMEYEPETWEQQGLKLKLNPSGGIDVKQAWGWQNYTSHKFVDQYLRDSDENADIGLFRTLPHFSRQFIDPDNDFNSYDGTKRKFAVSPKKPTKKPTKKTLPKHTKKSKRHEENSRHSARYRSKRHETVYSTGKPKNVRKTLHDHAASKILKKPYRSIQRVIGDMSPKAYEKFLKKVISITGTNPELRRK